MTKRLKRDIKRISIGAVVFVIGVLIEKFLHTSWADVMVIDKLSLTIGGLIGLAFYIAAYLVIGLEVVKTAFVNIAHGRVFDENFLMMVATFGAFGCREYTEAVAVILFYEIGECFQSYAVNKSRKSIKALMNIRPDFARIVVDGEEKEVDPSTVKVGDIIRIKPGERVPLDGEIIEGTTTLDTAAITGESLPREAKAGDAIVSGCVNQSGLISVRVSSEFGESTVSKILTLVEEASSKKAQAEKFITVFARYYTPIIVGSALLLAIVGSIVTGDFGTWIYRALTFLLISCPCALVISIPLSFFGGIGGAGKVGVLIKGGNYMETLSKIDTLVLDKTGTITKGNFAIGEVEISDYYKETYKDAATDRLIKYAAYSESYTTHPIGVSIIARYGQEINKDLISDVTEIAGKGVKATIDGHDYYVGNAKLMLDVLGADKKAEIEACASDLKAGTLVYVAEDNHLAGHLHIVDEIKDGAKEALAACRAAGISQIVMLTGDNEKTAQAVAEEVNLDKYYAGLTPMDKVSCIEDIISDPKTGKVAFVGDGINDAPVLSRADIGIAMGAMGSDAAIEAADVVIMTDELRRIVTAKKIAKKTLVIVKENIVFALGVKLLVLLLAATGNASMWAAIFADVGVAFLAIMNAMRALKTQE